MPASPKNRANLEAMINAKAWKDPKFKKKLLSDPHAALKEMGVDLKGVKVHVIEEDSHTVTFVLHHTPQNASGMSEMELRKIAGATGKMCEGHNKMTREL